MAAATVSPSTGDTNTDFTFTYQHSGATPAAAYLVIADATRKVQYFPVTPVNGLYQMVARLGVGTYTWQFQLHNGGAIQYINPTGPLTVTAAAVEPPPEPAQEPAFLKVSANKRYLVNAQGQPVFLVADTAWTAISSLNADEMAVYLAKRKLQGFNCILAIGAHWGAGSPQLVGGHRPFLNDNPATLDPVYWAAMDRLVHLAGVQGMIVGLVPCWNDYVNGSLRMVNANNGAAFGAAVGARYKAAPYLFWVLGGDLNPTGFEAVYRAIASGIKSAGAVQPITFHPGGGGTAAAAYFPNDAWLDFSSVQTYHELDERDHGYWILLDYNRQPTRPTFLMEYAYEQIIPWPKTSGQRIDDLTVRRGGYAAVLSGSCGIVYGCNGVFQFWKGPQEDYWKPRYTWSEALDLPGAKSIGILGSLFSSLQWWKLVPAPDMIAEGDATGIANVTGAKAADGSLAVVYVPVLVECVFNLYGMGPMVNVRWFNPRTGVYVSDVTVSNPGQIRTMPPSSMEDADYVCVIRTV